MKKNKRRDDVGSTTFYRSDRYYSEMGSWFAKTREGDELGPFDSKIEAKEALQAHIEIILTDEAKVSVCH
ncbi:MAG: hypothetical protein COB04_07940 [Gammaproteobacteria bacterium]|nr:MAG: hypothetical protein COB04_07940 [Gammaproteobacteria bacterium]